MNDTSRFFSIFSIPLKYFENELIQPFNATNNPISYMKISPQSLMVKKMIKVPFIRHYHYETRE